ncbi:lipoate synthase [Sphingopyxis sp. BE235]|nr:lipoate synthase [Sphingopyxis sp. BE235]MDR7182065.1 lipoate synthase [Sphingopyxis sp. BE249]
MAVPNNPASRALLNAAMFKILTAIANDDVRGYGNSPYVKLVKHVRIHWPEHVLVPRRPIQEYRA